jgi:hypothetical protein
MEPLNDLMVYCQQHGRVCPQPQLWQRLYELLPERRQIGAGFVPAAPLILGGWWHSSDQEKRSRLKAHIQWAADHQALDRVALFLRALQEREWHHEGE